MAISVLLAAGGCAKLPATGATAASTRLIFTMKVDGKLRNGSESGSAGLPYIYMVALNVSQQDNPITQGPIPVIAPPWGNGFVAGNATHFVQWDPTQATPFTIYQFKDSTLNQWAATGVPINYQLPATGSQVLQFEVALSQLVPDATQAALVRTLQVNFLTMDRIPQTGTTKFWDALGDSRNVSGINQYVNIPIRQSGVYDNNRFSLLEPRGDVVDPDLDIVDWSVEVRPN